MRLGEGGATCVVVINIETRVGRLMNLSLSQPLVGDTPFTYYYSYLPIVRYNTGRNNI